MNRKTFVLVLLVVLFLVFISASSCGTSSSSTKPKQELPFVQVNGISDVFEANFNDLTDLFGPNEAIGDNKENGLPEIDLVGVKAGDDQTFMRFDIYHAAPITLKADVFYGFVQYWTDGFDLYQYFPSTQELYLTLYDANGKATKQVSLDLEKAKVTLIPWSLAESNPVNIVTIIVDKNLHWGTNPGSTSSLIIRFVSGFYSKEKGSVITDMTPIIKIEFNY